MHALVQDDCLDAAGQNRRILVILFGGLVFFQRMEGTVADRV